MTFFHKESPLWWLLALPYWGAGVAVAQPAVETGLPEKQLYERLEPMSGTVIENVWIRTARGPCIVVRAGVHDVVIRNARIGPCGQDHVNDYGVLILEGAHNITVSGNVIHGVSTGVKAYQASHPLTIERNRFFGIRGPGWSGQAVQFNGVAGGQGASSIRCNVSDASVPGWPSAYEDHISLYNSHGTPDNPILVEFNRMRGGSSRTGGGITIGDKGGSWQVVRGNTVVRVANSGIGVAGGYHITVLDNKVDNRGESAQTLTHLAYFVRALSPCGSIRLSGNRGIARLWNWGEPHGDTVPGYRHGPQRCADMDDADNQFGDSTLSPALFDEVPPACAKP